MARSRFHARTRAAETHASIHTERVWGTSAHTMHAHSSLAHTMHADTSARRSRSTATAAVLGLALTAAACSKAAPPDSAPQLVAVAAAVVSGDSVAQPIVATGTFGPRDSIALSFKIGGVIARLAVDEGQVVHKGQTLAALDLREIDAMVDKAAIGVAKAERDEARIRRLATDSVATPVQAQDAASALAAARADLATARVNREYAVIVAPEDGTVLRRNVTAGVTIGAGMPVVQLAGTTRGRVLRAGLPDRDALRVHAGDAATVTFDALPGRSFAGRVTLLGSSADARTGTYAVEVTMNDAATLPSGLVGQLRIRPRAAGRVALVPVDALLEADADSATVFELATGNEPVATARRVHVLQLDGDRAAIAGLAEGARIVTRGAPYVTAGARVRVISNASVATASKAGAP